MTCKEDKITALLLTSPLSKDERINNVLWRVLETNDKEIVSGAGPGDGDDDDGGGGGGGGSWWRDWQIRAFVRVDWLRPHAAVCV